MSVQRMGRHRPLPKPRCRSLSRASFRPSLRSTQQAPVTTILLTSSNRCSIERKPMHGVVRRRQSQQASSLHDRGSAIGRACCLASGVPARVSRARILASRPGRNDGIPTRAGGHSTKAILDRWLEAARGTNRSQSGRHTPVLAILSLQLNARADKDVPIALVSSGQRRFAGMSVNTQGGRTCMIDNSNQSLRS
jgi:hypothetical protein